MTFADEWIWTTDVCFGSNCSTNCATTTALNLHDKVIELINHFDTTTLHYFMFQTYVIDKSMAVGPCPM